MLAGKFGHQLHVLLAGGILAEARELMPSVILGDGLKVEAAGAGAGHIAIGGLLVQGIQLEQHSVGGLGGQLLGAQGSGLKVLLGCHKSES
jgi:hypothetical protein